MSDTGQTSGPPASVPPSPIPRADPPAPPRRRRYLDWMRGFAVVIMIEAHLFDSWTEAASRSTVWFTRAIILGGFGAPLFLLLAGVAVALSASSRSRRLGSESAAVRAVARRGLEIFLLAFLFRVQAWILGLGSPWGLLRVDILNIMGPSIVAAAWLWGSCRSTGSRVLAFALATLATTLLTPLVRAATWLDAVPDPLEAYLRPVRDFSNFMFFPWAGFVFAGAALGVLIERTRTTAAEDRLNALAVAGGLGLAAAAYGMSFRPSLYPRSEFWTSSPSFFLLRLGLLIAAVGVAYAWTRAPWAGGWSPMEQLGRTSLFIYWIHVEMLYGLVSMKLHRALSFGEACLGFVLFSGFMLLCSIWKDRAVAAWRRRRRPAPPRLQPTGR